MFAFAFVSQFPVCLHHTFKGRQLFSSVYILSLFWNLKCVRKVQLKLNIITWTALTLLALCNESGVEVQGGAHHALWNQGTQEEGLCVYIQGKQRYKSHILNRNIRSAESQVQDKQAYTCTHTRKSTFEDKPKPVSTSVPTVPGWEGASQVHGRWWVRGANAHWSIPTPLTSQAWIRSHPHHSSVCVGDGEAIYRLRLFSFFKKAHIKRHSCSIILFHN